MKMYTAVLLALAVILFSGNAFATPPNSHKKLAQEIKIHLKKHELYSPEMYSLLLGTAATESDFGDNKNPGDNGVALGVFQIQTFTHNDIWKHWLPSHPKLRAKAESAKWKFVPIKYQLHHNLEYQTVMAAIHYLRACERLEAKLPKHNDYWTQAWWWKTQFNTHLGKGTTWRFYTQYKEIVISALKT